MKGKAGIGKRASLGSPFCAVAAQKGLPYGDGEQEIGGCGAWVGGIAPQSRLWMFDRHAPSRFDDPTIQNPCFLHVSNELRLQSDAGGAQRRRQHDSHPPKGGFLDSGTKTELSQKARSRRRRFHKTWVAATGVAAYNTPQMNSVSGRGEIPHWRLPEGVRVKPEVRDLGRRSVHALTSARLIR